MDNGNFTGQTTHETPFFPRLIVANEFSDSLIKRYLTLTSNLAHCFMAFHPLSIY